MTNKERLLILGLGASVAGALAIAHPRVNTLTGQAVIVRYEDAC